MPKDAKNRGLPADMMDDEEEQKLLEEDEMTKGLMEMDGEMTEDYQEEQKRRRQVAQRNRK